MMSLKFLLFEFCFLLLFAYSQQNRLPATLWKSKSFVDQKRLAPLRVSGDEERSSRYENSQLRKANDGLDRYKERLHLRDYRYRHRLPESEFDAEGMLYLSIPRFRKDKALNRLMNKVAAYVASKNNGYLREKPKLAFTKDEIKQLEVIVGSEEREDRLPIGKKRPKRVPDVVLNFADLVI